MPQSNSGLKGRAVKAHGAALDFHSATRWASSRIVFAFPPPILYNSDRVGTDS